MKLYKAKCSQCGRMMRRKTRSELLSALRKHLWKDHRNWMVARIKAGKRNAEQNNPSIQDVVQAIQKGSTRAAHAVAGQMTEGRYQQVKQVMDAVQPLLPLKAALAWEGVEAVHDIVKRKKGGNTRK
ncbi:hypothetical protein ES703_117959 [subsurface metagenome]